jgi:hypothetical protein
MTLNLLKVHLQTFLSVKINKKFQILSCGTLVANELYICEYLAAVSNSLEILYALFRTLMSHFVTYAILEDQSYKEVLRVTLTQLHSFLWCFVSSNDVIVRHPARTLGKRSTYRCKNGKGMTQRHNGRK